MPEDRAFIPESIFHRALLNLIVNSAEATGEQGQILVKASGDDENIRIEVNDDGPGIPPTHKGTARFPSIRTLVEADLRVWLPVMAVILDEEKIQQILADAEQALSAYVDEHGQAVFSVSAHIITGTK